MWDITFPKTPEGEKEIAVYYDQQSCDYVKLTIKDKNILVRYFWDGISDSFNFIEIDPIIELCED